MKRLFVFILLLIAAAGTLTANGGRDGGDAPIIEVTHGASDDTRVGIYQKVFQQLVDEYNAENGTGCILNFVGNQGIPV